MAWKKCRFCGKSLWGYWKQIEHEEERHPRKYYLAAAETLEMNAQAMINSAAIYRERAAKVGSTAPR